MKMGRSIRAAAISGRLCLLGLEAQQIGEEPYHVPVGGQPADQAKVGLRRQTGGEKAAQWLHETGVAEIGQAGLPLRAGDQILREQRTPQNSGHVRHLIRDAQER